MVASPVIVGRSPTTTVRMHRVNFVATVDTGSDVTTMTEECFRRSFSGVPLEQLSWLTITAANGGELPYIGYFVADIHIDEFIIPWRGILVVRVSKDVPMLLGMNALKELPPDVNRPHATIEEELRRSRQVGHGEHSGALYPLHKEKKLKSFAGTEGQDVLGFIGCQAAIKLRKLERIEAVNFIIAHLEGCAPQRDTPSSYVVSCRPRKVAGYSQEIFRERRSLGGGLVRVV
ncbi:hypothetical protein BSL78_03306 [Apostichopus japonicus]|uniref:Uncharacterized protein n=1 Tax=Stichopus japonicus TaxID=307972 RepID=A0A2G8LHK9_STIJA|nr:hypothetical protein BSL78_03306 [Apostichopus japonicus]